MHSRQGLCLLTRVWTIWGLCIRKLFTVWNTSSRPSALTRSKILLSAMNVPVRPAPALQHTQTHETLEHEQRLAYTNCSKHSCAKLCIRKQINTCSVRRWDGSQTAAAVSALRRWCRSCLSPRPGCRPPASRGSGSAWSILSASPLRGNAQADKGSYTFQMWFISSTWKFILAGAMSM